MTDYEKVRNRLLAEKILKGLKTRGYEAYFVENAEEANAQALSIIGSEDLVGWGGSSTLKSLGIKDILREKKIPVIDRDNAASKEEKEEMQRRALTSDVFMSSVNAITEDGEMLNIDGIGNRIAPIAYGPKKVILFVGMNKVCRDMDHARARVRSYVAPANSVRLKIDAPCTKTGSCHDCQSPQSICSQIVEMRRNRIPGRIHVILINEELGL